VDRRAEPVRSVAATLFVFCWVGVFGSFAAALLAPSLFPERTGIAYLLGALIAAVAYDVGALGTGAWLGRHPMSRVSPGKTWEGALGGAVAAVVFAVAVVRLVHPWTLGEAAVLGVVVAVVSPIGDLAESLVKRQLGLKDMGRILPGHGGLLDRVDGLLFVLPATYYLVRAFGHG
jgi:phosphatidate cytidylyltransferase